MLKIKKIISFFLILVLVIPITVCAKKYNLSDTDMSIDMDDTEWYVFTRDNLKNNSELDELGISYDYLYNVMNSNYIYLDAILYFETDDDYIEFFVRKKKQVEVNNLSNYSNDEVLELAEELAGKHNAKKYEIYNNNYKFIKLDYYEKGLYLNEYYTIINGYGYTFTAQKPKSFSLNDQLRVKNIIDSIIFDIDESLEDGSSYKGIDWSEVIVTALIGGAIGGISSIFGYLFNKKRKK